MTICSSCKKEYGTYPVFLSGNIECYLMEEHIKDLCYDDERDVGLCKECRKKETSDPVWMIRAWLNVKLQLMVAQGKYKDDKEQSKEIKEALERIEKYEARLEETPEVKALYLKNNPAGFKKEPPTGKCAFCGENDAKVWINDPNEMEPKIENCWGVCIPCGKIIERQSESSFLKGVNRRLEERGIEPKELGKKRIEQLDKEIQEIANEDCQEVACISIEKKEDGEFEAKREY